MQKIRTKEEYDLFYLKKAYKNFWTHHWIPGRDAQVWTEILVKARAYKSNMSITLIKRALVKFELDEQITLQQRIDLEKMLDSPDEENIFIAMSIMAQLRPRSFGRRKDKKKRKLLI